jgi:hypothetical protein
MKVKLVTGYCPIPGHPRTAEEYGVLGEKFRAITKVPLKAYYTQAAALWAQRLVWEASFRATHSEGDNPEKNTVAYHAVNHQKSEWLLRAMMDDPGYDSYVWVDYGICHLPGVTPELIEDFALRIGKDDFAIPGCWGKPGHMDDITDAYPSWRFCGSVLVVPRDHVLAFDAAVKTTLTRHLQRMRNMPWEVNTWARVENRYATLPIRWYKADHNETLFSNYEAPDDAAV